MRGTVSVDRYSFPSGHTTRATFVALFFAQYAVGATLAFLAVWAAGTGISRITMGRHHVLDVVCGGLCGAVLFYALDRASWLYIPELLSFET